MVAFPTVLRHTELQGLVAFLHIDPRIVILYIDMLLTPHVDDSLDQPIVHFRTRPLDHEYGLLDKCY